MLANFEILLLAGENKTIPNLEFAHLTFDELKQKITDMLEGEDWGKVISFDYNEAWILYTSLAMYIAEMQITKNPIRQNFRYAWHSAINSMLSLEANR